MPDITVTKTSSSATIEADRSGDGLLLYCINDVQMYEPQTIETGLVVEVPTGWEARLELHENSTEQNWFVSLSRLTAGTRPVTFRMLNANYQVGNAVPKDVPIARLIFRQLDSVTFVAEA